MIFLKNEYNLDIHILVQKDICKIAGKYFEKLKLDNETLLVFPRNIFSLNYILA